MTRISIVAAAVMMAFAAPVNAELNLLRMWQNPAPPAPTPSLSDQRATAPGAAGMQAAPATKMMMGPMQSGHMPSMPSSMMASGCTSGNCGMGGCSTGNCATGNCGKGNCGKGGCASGYRAFTAVMRRCGWNQPVINRRPNFNCNYMIGCGDGCGPRAMVCKPKLNLYWLHGGSYRPVCGPTKSWGCETGQYVNYRVKKLFSGKQCCNASTCGVLGRFRCRSNSGSCSSGSCSSGGCSGTQVGHDCGGQGCGQAGCSSCQAAPMQGVPMQGTPQMQGVPEPAAPKTAPMKVDVPTPTTTMRMPASFIYRRK